MKKITEKQISNIVTKIQDKNYALPELMKKFEKQQPHLFEYLDIIDDGQMTNHEVALFRHVVLLAWYIISETRGSVDTVDNSFIDILVDRNADLLEILHTNADGSEDIIELLTTYNEQKDLMEFLLAMLYQPGDTDKKVREIAFFILVLPLKTIVDTLVLDEDKWSKKLERRYSEKDHKKSLETIKGMFKKFTGSQLYNELKPTRKEDAETIITLLADLMYKHHVRMPAEWKTRHVLDCCINLFPEAVTDDRPITENIVPVLVSFFMFTGENNLIPLSEEMAEIIPEYEGEISGSATMLPESGTQKVGRNDPCPCGSGKKYKKCCGV